MVAWSNLSVGPPSPKTKLTLQRLGQLASILRLLILLKFLVKASRHVYAYGILGTAEQGYIALKNFVVRLALSLPSSQRQIKEQLGEVRKQLVQKLAPREFPEGVDLTICRELPANGRDIEWLRKEWTNMDKLNRGDVEKGRVSGAVYHGGEDLNTVISEAMAHYVVSNPLHPDVFPGVRKMEAEMVEMVLGLFHGKDGAGTTTAGGTESILMSCKTHRDWARAVKGIKEPEMVIPETAHAAFWKASQYFKIKLHVVPVNPTTRQADVKRMKRFINPNTIMIVGSAPNFPDGAIDPIPELSALAQRYKIGLHVDCCLGSFIVAFSKEAGYGDKIPKFDFELPGVTAISCDTHKYAFCPKGTSVIMYRSRELRRYQYYSMTDWVGGVYASPSMAGSRPGSVIAGAWAVLNHVGREGYLESAKQIIGAARHFKDEIRRRFPLDFEIMGDPQLSVVAIKSDTVNIYSIGDRMGKRGWHLNALSRPAGLHMAFTRLSAMSVDKLLDDLAECLKEEKENPGKDSGDLVALYGIGQTSVGPAIVDEFAKTFLDVLYE
ncbi:sphinganine-1-phosphate aldolase [Trichosporon asahii var. asahii CBS 2479]|uniref:sphinganine-1-phosphate aldolase n=1 Tax=Trichosporon asahii var. asahii (strain ATCC 90039 / CBS 2479 / JCM 2466 / KCTC 7840 / NBRC 103889/ NCYC 2677 / UAMH 7654) TaxID=1186058 RepID=J5TK41_TRIAS|nr:sphinganine-1-phosphate aldolase [Trichosporon asahii var. asahii CBS 2479]EJT51306.1 sphinganine-1-phosphate aldolase [Trichosporon asahii var. asahii CBS 2479]